jgi:hypothetical protein
LVILIDEIDGCSCHGEFADQYPSLFVKDSVSPSRKTQEIDLFSLRFVVSSRHTLRRPKIDNGT